MRRTSTRPCEQAGASLVSILVVVVAVAGVVAFLIWLNHFVDAIGF